MLLPFFRNKNAAHHLTQSLPARGYMITTQGLPISPGACHEQGNLGTSFAFHVCTSQWTQVMENTCKWEQSLKDSQLTLLKVQHEPRVRVAMTSHFYLGTPV